MPAKRGWIKRSRQLTRLLVSCVVSCPRCSRGLYRERPLIERTINRLKRFRRVATRYEKLASSYLAMVTFAMILEWL
jgi:transposase